MRVGANNGGRGARPRLGAFFLLACILAGQSTDDHGDTPAEATALSAGSSVQGRIETGDDVDYFRLQIPAQSDVEIYTTGSLDTVGSLRDSSNAGIAENDDGGTGTNFRIARRLAAGVYYIAVSSYESGTGSYTLHVSVTGGGTPPPASGPIITTVAGDGTPRYGGDGGPAAQAQLRYPNSVAVDGLGNLYIADLENNRIRKVDAAGVITTVAGDGTRGYGGDGGPAVEAQLWYPTSVAVDGSGNLYIADLENHRIRKVDAAGVITTVAGTGWPRYGGDGGPAVEAQLWYPQDMAVDGLGNLYIADTANHRIRKVDAAGIITTVAGDGTTRYGGDGGPAVEAQLWGPRSVAVDGLGNLYIADSANNRIRRVDAAGTIATVAGTGESGYGGDGGPAVEAQLRAPNSVAVDGSGNLYIADWGNHRIRKVDAAGIITTVAGDGTRGYGGDGGPAAQAQLWHPTSVAVDGSGNLYIADWGNHRIRRVGGASAPPPTVSLTASPSSIASGGSATLRWSSTNAASAEIDQNIGAVATSGSRTVSPTATTTYRITVTSADGRTATDSATVTVTAPPPTVSLTASPSSIASGGSATLRWSSTNAASAEIDQNIGAVATSGSRTVSPTATTTYRITVTSADGRTATDSATVTVTAPPPTVSLTASPSSIASGGSATLRWSSTNAASAEIDQNIGAVATSGSRTVSPTATTTYRITVTSADGRTATDSATVTVTAPPPTVSLTASPSSIASGGSATLRWSSTNAASAEIDQNIGAVATSGSRTVSPTATTTYRITVTSADGRTATDSATVTVTAPPPTVSLTASPSSIASGGSATLRWSSTNAASAEIDQNIGAVATSGSRTVSPTATTTYRITVTSADGRTATDSATVTVTAPPPTVSLTASPSSIASGGSATLRWSSTNAASAEIDQNIGAVATSGSRTVSPTATTTYRITVTSADGRTATDSATVTVTAPPPTVSLTASPSSIASGGSATLRWSSTNAASAEIDQNIGAVATSGSRTVSPTATTTYRITVTSADGRTATDSATVTVTAPPPTPASGPIITTVAGDGTRGYGGDGGPAAQAQLRYPNSVAVDGLGNLYIADVENHRIRKVDAAGVITTVAGTGWPRYRGDGGPAVEAQLWGPQDMAVDGLGNLYIADTSNNRIRRVDAAGTITTVAGDRRRGYGGDGGPAVEAQLWGPRSVAVDGLGNLYIADSANNRIRRVDAAGTITTVAGDRRRGYGGDGGPAVEAQLWGPRSVAVDGLGNLYIADSGNNRIRRVDAAGTITTVAGDRRRGYFGDGVPAAQAQLDTPWGVAVDGSGNLYIADWGNHRIRKVDAAGIITTVAGDGTRGYGGDGGPAAQAQLRYPTSVAVDGSGNLYIADWGNHRIRRVGGASAPPPTVSLTASPSSIASGGSATLRWSSTNAASAEIDQNIGAVATSGSRTVSPTATTTYRITVTSADGRTATDSATVTVTAPPPTVSLTASPSSIASGGSATLRWSSTNAASAEIDQNIGAVATSGSRTVSPTATTTYRITVTSADGRTATDSATVTVTAPPPTVSLTASPSSIASGGSATLRWSSTNAASAEIDQNIGAVATSGSRTVSPTATTTYRITVTSADGRTATDSATVTVTAPPPTPAGRGIITTVAGPGDFGDGGPAAAALLRGPRSVALDEAGNLYIADLGNHRIRRVDAAGTIATVAGTGEQGYSGDGGPATQAQLDFPEGVALDEAGNLYIADTWNHRIRKVDAAGVITTVAGDGTFGYGGDGGPATQAQLSQPDDVALDEAGNLYITDHGNNRIRRVDAAGTITTVAGGGRPAASLGDGGPATQARLASPEGVALDEAGNLYIADLGNHRIRRVDAAGTIATVAGTGEPGYSGDGGPATQAQLHSPFGVALDAAGNLYIADTQYNRIRRVDAAGTIATVAGTGEPGYSGDGGPATQAQLSQPDDVALDAAGNLYIADLGNHRIRRVDAAGTIATVAGTGDLGDSGPALQARLDYPQEVAADAAGNLYIADGNNHRIRKVDAASGVITTVAGNGTRGYGGDGGPAAQAQLNEPIGVAVDGAGNLYIADHNNRIRRVDAAGTIATVAGTGEYGYSGDGGPATQAQLHSPFGVAVDGAGNLYIADHNNRIRRVDAAGTIATVAGTGEYGYSGDGGPAAQAQLNEPIGVAVDAAGNLYIADLGNHRIRRVDAAGTIATVAGTGEYGYSGDGGPATQAQLSQPFGVALDEAGNLYIADLGNHRIRRVDAAGTIATVAGTGEQGYSGDGGPATQAQLDFPEGVALDEAGNLYIADLGNHRIRKVTFSTAPPPGIAPQIFSDGIMLATSTPVVNRISANALISVFGKEFTPEGTLASSPVLDSAGSVAAKLADTCLEIAGQRAPLFAVSPSQINAQAPHGLASGRVRVEVVRGCDTPEEQRGGAFVDTAAVSPAFFNFLNNSNGRNPIVALHDGGGLVGAPGLILWLPFTPAEPGEFIILYGTGFGATDPPLAAGEIPRTVYADNPSTPLATTDVRVSFGGMEVAPEDILYIGGTPDGAGLYQLVVKVPDAAPDGELPVTLTIDGVSSPQGPFVAVQAPAPPSDGYTPLDF